MKSSSGRLSWSKISWSRINNSIRSDWLTSVRTIVNQNNFSEQLFGRSLEHGKNRSHDQCERFVVKNHDDRRHWKVVGIFDGSTVIRSNVRQLTIERNQAGYKFVDGVNFPAFVDLLLDVERKVRRENDGLTHMTRVGEIQQLVQVCDFLRNLWWIEKRFWHWCRDELSLARPYFHLFNTLLRLGKVVLKIIKNRNILGFQLCFLGFFHFPVIISTWRVCVRPRGKESQQQKPNKSDEDKKFDQRDASR